jgi:hypothetical protein
MTAGDLADQPPAFRAASIDARHLGAGPRLIDEHQPLRIKARLILLPALARLGDVRPILLGRVLRLFLRLMPCRWKNRRSALAEVFTPTASARRRSISARVRSASSAFSAKSHAAWASSGERLWPPRGRGRTLPVASCNSAQRIADDGLTLNRAAACRRDTPAATSATTRARRSSE